MAGQNLVQFLSKDDILGTAQEVAAAAGTGRPALGSPNVLSTANTALNVANNTLGQVESIVNGLANIMGSVERMRGTANQIMPKKEELLPNPQVVSNQNQVVQKPEAEEKKIMKISLNEDAAKKAISDFFTDLGNQPDEYKKKTIAEISEMYKSPIFKPLLESAAMDKLRKIFPELIKVS